MITVSIVVTMSLVICLVLYSLNKAYRELDAKKKDRIDQRLHKIDIEHLGHLYVPNCTHCKGTGWIEKRSGALVHTTSRVSCSCRAMENWLLSLIDKWIAEGDVYHATELLLILKEKN